MRYPLGRDDTLGKGHGFGECEAINGKQLERLGQDQLARWHILRTKLAVGCKQLGASNMEMIDDALQRHGGGLMDGSLAEKLDDGFQISHPEDV